MTEKNRGKEKIIFVGIVAVVAVLLLLIFVNATNKKVNIENFPSKLSVLPTEMTTDFINNVETEELVQNVRISGSDFTMFVPAGAGVGEDFIKGSQNGVLYYIDTSTTASLREESSRKEVILEAFGNTVMNAPFGKIKMNEEAAKEGYLGKYKAAYAVYSVSATVSIRTVNYEMFVYIVPISATDSVLICTFGDIREDLAAAHQLLVDMGMSLRSYEDAFDGVNDAIREELLGESSAQDAILESESAESYEKESENAIESTEKSSESESSEEIGYVGSENVEGELFEVAENINIGGGGELGYIMFDWGGEKPVELHLYYPDYEDEAAYIERYCFEDKICFEMYAFPQGIYKLRGTSVKPLGKPKVELYSYIDFYDKYLIDFEE